MIVKLSSFVVGPWGQQTVEVMRSIVAMAVTEVCKSWLGHCIVDLPRCYIITTVEGKLLANPETSVFGSRAAWR